MTQEVLAEKAGLSPHTINQIENRRKFCGLATIASIANALKVEETELFKDPTLFDVGTALVVLRNFVEEKR